MAELAQGWTWLNQNAWIASAMLAIALTGGALTMTWHIARTHAHRSNYLAIVGLLLLAISFVLTGVSVGDRPIIAGRQLIPAIRILWLASGLIFNGYLVVYWSRRIIVLGA